MARIVLDPGHGGWQSFPKDSSWNNAAGPNGTLEKNLTLDVGRRAYAALQAKGHDVRLTRDQDVNLRLRDRAKVARDFQAHAFVSIHFNGSGNHTAQGTETLVHTYHSPKSAELSLAVQDALLRVTKHTDRNKTFDRKTRIKPQSLGVLRPDAHAMSTAACLAEVSFLDRADEEKRLESESYRQRIGEAIARGIEHFTGTARTLIPADEIEAGDAIELAALSTQGDDMDAVAFLDLDKARIEPDQPPTEGTADKAEAPGMPAQMFSVAFVENTGPPFALIVNEPQWPDLGDFTAFVEGLKLKNFTPDEFLFLGASNRTGTCKNKNSFPPKALWKNIKHTALMLDAIRDELGVPIRILSCYRAPPYNKCVKGEAGSLHMKFNAVDFTCAEGTPEIWRRVANSLRDSDRHFLGGIGIYPAKNFLHIDTRGKAADWRGK